MTPLVDQATSPAAKAARKVQRMGGVMTEAGQKQIAFANRQRDAAKSRQSALRGEAMETAGLAAALYGLTEPAVQAEKRMAEVAKVVDFKDANGFKLLANDIGRLVTDGGLAATASGVTDIVAAAGRMGVVAANLPDAEKRRQLLEFATAASKMSVAFGISAEESGVALARWRQNLGLSQQQALLLGDAVNTLGNTMATSEADIMQVINRQGTVAKTAGLAAQETAALSAAILAAGASPEIAATGMKNFVNALTKGESLTKRQSSAMKVLGLDGLEMAKRMQTDATGAIFSVLEAFQKVEPYRRNSLIGDLFGEEAKGAIAPLIDNMELFSGALERVSDANAIAGSTEAEYARQAATSAAQRRLFINQLERMSVLIGTHLLPVMIEVMASIGPIVRQIGEWAEANPDLIQTIAWVAVGLIALKLASLALFYPLSLLRGGLCHIGSNGRICQHRCRQTVAYSGPSGQSFSPSLGACNPASEMGQIHLRHSVTEPAGQALLVGPDHAPEMDHVHSQACLENPDHPAEMGRICPQAGLEGFGHTFEMDHPDIACHPLGTRRFLVLETTHSGIGLVKVYRQSKSRRDRCAGQSGAVPPWHPERDACSGDIC